MREVVLAHEADWDGWRAAVRGLVAARVPPDQVAWSVRERADLFGEPPDADPPAPAAFTLKRALVELAQTAILAREGERFAWLYGLVWRVLCGERALLEDAADPDVVRVQRLAGWVRRDIHKMRAFLRFRAVSTAEGPRYVAWFEPEHHILAANAPFFVRRFAGMVWSILTPEQSAHWDGTTLRLGPGAARSEVPDDDALEAYWRTYFAAIFNPARLKVSAMLSEMPRKYWRNLPEAAAIPELIRTAPGRAAVMVEQPVISPPRPASRAVVSAPDAGALTPLGAARHAAAGCQSCALYAHATQTVFGEGPEDARIMLVGEQPGDQEDLAGRPFVGPAGKMLDAALAEAGLDRAQVYVTNAVKHFKFEPRGKRRIHQKPDTAEILACGQWLSREREAVRPVLTVLLGATAARAVLGRAVAIGRERGHPIPIAGNAQALVTVHPSYLLRLPDAASKQREYAAFVADLRLAVQLAA